MWLLGNTVFARDSLACWRRTQIYRAVEEIWLSRGDRIEALGATGMRVECVHLQIKRELIDGAAPLVSWAGCLFDFGQR